jgi:transcriptional regulator with XRE-family HTH domain
MFGSRLAAERKRLKLSQEAVATVLGTSRSVVGMIETDQTSLGAERLLKLGSAGFDVLKVLTDEPGTMAAGRLLNWDLALKISAAVDDWAKTRGVKLHADKKHLLVKHLYLQFASREQIDESMLNETLQMAA